MEKYLKKEYICVCVHVYFSRVQQFVTLWTVAHQAPLSMRFSRQDTGVRCHALLQYLRLYTHTCVCVCVYVYY